MKCLIPALLFLFSISHAPAAERSALEIHGARRIETTRAVVTLRGTVARGMDWVLCSTNRRPWRTIYFPEAGAAVGKWKFRCHLRPGRNVIYFTANYHDALGRDRFASYQHVTVYRRLPRSQTAPTPVPPPDVAGAPE